LRHKDNDFFFSVLNIYGPYTDRIPFWEDLKDAGAFNEPFTVVGGDLNFTLSSREVWGESSREDQQGGFFQSFLEKLHLVDLEPTKITPTWRNLRTGNEAVAKRLDIFLVSKPFWKWVLL
jgi:hypothetical protein